MRAWVLAFMALIGSGVSAQISLPMELPNAVDGVRDADDFRLFANLFPQAGAQFKPDIDSVMTAEQLGNAAGYLSDMLDGQKRIAAKERPTIEAALAILGVRPIVPSDARQTRLTLRDDANSWSTAISPQEIRIGARFLRGLVLGSLREAVSGKATLSQALGSFLGSASGKTIDDVELERRARLYFAAARNGVSEMRTDADFDEHFRQTVALHDQSKDAAVFDELEKRLTAAAGGGKITGADGMAINELFLELGFHFNPALLFVLSHELGHVILGHVPFPANLTCSEKQQREHDADAFAIALLAYDIPGDTEAEAISLAAMGLGPPADRDDADLDFGYTHAVRYGFALGGLTNRIDTDCTYLGADERIRQLDQWRALLMARRSAAYADALGAFRAAPAYVYIADLDELADAERIAQARRLYPSCRAGPAPKRPTVRKLEDLPFGYAVGCPHSMPKVLADQDLRLRLGIDTAERLAAEYSKHVPQLMSEKTLKALQPPSEVGGEE